MINPKVSIVIPCYNQGQYLNDCLGSLKNQTFQDFEVIIVNDGSTEKITLDILDKIPLNPPSKKGAVKVLHKKNGGLSSTRNHGIKHAKGDWIVPLDADDMLAPTYLEKTLKLVENKNLDFVATWIKHFGLTDSIYKTRLFPALERFNNFLPYCALFKKEIFDQEKYDENFKEGFEDWDLWIHIVKKFNGKIIPEPLFLYRKKETSMLSDARKKYFKIIWQMWRKTP